MRTTNFSYRIFGLFGRPSKSLIVASAYLSNTYSAYSMLPFEDSTPIRLVNSYEDFVSFKNIVRNSMSLSCLTV